MEEIVKLSLARVALLSAVVFCANVLASPQPEDIVNLVIDQHAGGGETRRVIYEVPRDRWLVMTDVSPMGSAGGGTVSVISRSGEKDTAKLTTHGGYNSV